MAQFTAANAAPFGHQGAMGREAHHSAGRPRPKALKHCFVMVRGQGYPSAYFSKIGARHTAAVESEGVAAATPSALNSPSGVTVTPAGFLLSLAINAQAVNRSLDVNDPTSIAREEIENACGRYLMDDSTVGMGKLFESVTATEGDPGTTLTLQGLLDSNATVRQNLNGASLWVSDIIDGKGAEDVMQDITNNAASYLGNPVVESFVRSFAAEGAGAFDPDDGYWMSPDSRSGIFVEDGYSMLSQAGTDRIGCAIISHTPAIVGRARNLGGMQNGTGRNISPAFALAIDEDPVAGAREGMIKVEMVDTESGPIAISTDANVGPNYVTYRGRGISSVALVNDNSACQIPYLA